MYADDRFRIFKIVENTQPYSTENIPSGKKAKYVIEVKAGFASQHNIGQGNRFSYEKD